jgi:hypothetical protein
MFVLRELSEANGGDIYNIDFPIEDGITIAKAWKPMHDYLKVSS